MRWLGWYRTRTAALVAAMAMGSSSRTSLGQTGTATRAAISVDTVAADSMVAAAYARDSIASITAGMVESDRLVWTRS